MRIQQVFAEVVGLDDERRSARLERIEDSGIRREVQTLLDRHARGEPLLDEASSPPQRGVEEHEVVGRYRLLDELGRGAMGVVYRAEDTRLGRPVALKFLSPELSADRRARARLEREARAASALDHPNICTVYEIGETDDGRLYLALACYDGETLERRIERGPLEVEEAVRTAVHIARGLAAAHRHGIVHRDVKPSNVLVTDDRAVKLLDFGIARVADSELTGSGDVLGTVAYMSPEQLRGEVDARVDVWALGVVLYEMLTGKRPFRGDYEAALLYAVLHEAPAPLDRDDVPEELAEIVRRCLEKDPDDRYQSAEEVEVALERLGLGSASVPPVRSVFRRKRFLALGASVAVLAVAFLFTPLGEMGAGWFGLSRGPDVRHLAVLPLMTSPEEAAVGEGLTLTLTSLLTQIGAQAQQPITVVPASEMREITTAADAHERFGVDVAVSGDLRRRDGHVHLILDLIDARTLRTLDSRQLSESSKRWYNLQQGAVGVMAEMLDLQLTADQQAQLATGGTANGAAFEFYLKGEAALDQFDRPENVDMAIEMFRWALEEDSVFALAHAALGRAYMWKYRSTRDTAWVTRAERQSHRALAIADRLSPVRVTLGVLYNLIGDRAAAVEQFRIAIGLDSLNADAHFGLAAAYQALQRTDEAERAYRQTIRLQPTNWQPHNDLGNLYILTGHYGEAIKHFQQAVALAPSEVRPYEGMAGAHLYQESLDEARVWAQRALNIRPSYIAYSYLGDASYLAEDYEAAARSYERALQINDTDYLVWGNLADVYGFIPGRDAEATAAYQRAIQGAEEWRSISPSDPEILSDLAAYHAKLGQEKEAVMMLDAVDMGVSADMYLAERVATLYAKLGHEQKAITWIEEAIRRGRSLAEIEGQPVLRDLLPQLEYDAVQ